MNHYTNSSRGFGSITFADRLAMDESIREMHGRDFGDRVISVNRAELKMGRDDGKVTALELVAETVAIHLLAREALVAVLTVIPTVTDMWTVNVT
ncbi:hypothetical protein Bca52824_050410 [Brassica carinata]|uniref:RRM domain-containing protein n=1 Tax=Brassica carinata TaxID=52824 RepID=A0A8X7R2D2_BRACI|nr:hypothetical protein Bca52824_050410 [Brassica carinata]